MQVKSSRDVTIETQCGVECAKVVRVGTKEI